VQSGGYFGDYLEADKYGEDKDGNVNDESFHDYFFLS